MSRATDERTAPDTASGAVLLEQDSAVEHPWTQLSVVIHGTL